MSSTSLVRFESNSTQRSGADQGPLFIPKSFTSFLGKFGIQFEDFTDDETRASLASDNDAPEDLRELMRELTIPIHGANHIRQSAKKGQFWAKLGILRLLSIYLIFPIWVNKSLGKCDDEDTKEFGLGSAVGHDGWMFLTFLFVYFPMFFYLQSKCLQAVLGTHLKSVRAKTISTTPEIIGSNYPPFQMLINWVWVKCKGPLDNDTTFWLWFLSVSIIPFFARHMAFMWNAEILGMVMTTDTDFSSNSLVTECVQHSRFQDVWAKTMQQSLYYKYACWFLHWEPSDAQFANFVALAYGIVFLEFVFAFATTVRVPQIQGCGIEHLPNNSTTLRFKTVYDISGTNDLSVLMHQADIACFDAVTDLQTKWELGRLRNFTQLMEGNAKGFDGLSRPEQIDYLYSFLTQVQRMVAKFALAGLAQNVVTANVQISFLAILIHEMGWDKFWKPMYMVFVNILLCLVGTIFAGFDLFAILECHKEFNRHDISINTVHGGHATRLYDRIRKILYRRLPIYVFLYGALTIWNIWKFAAIFYCDSHLLNIPNCVPPDS